MSEINTPAYIDDEGFTGDPKHKALYELMSDLSEECWCAGWMDGTEYALWLILTDHASMPMIGRWGAGFVTTTEQIKLKELSDEIGGWLMWYDPPGATFASGGVVFVSLDQWLAEYAGWESAYQQRRERQEI